MQFLPEGGQCPSGEENAPYDARRRKRKNFLLATVELGVLLLEAVDTTSGVDETLLASVEWVAVGANFNVNVFTLSGKGFSFKATCARHLSFVHFWMDIFFHDYLVKKDAEQLSIRVKGLFGKS